VCFSKDAADTTVDLFDQEMKYLHDDGFKVLTINQLGYDTTNNSFYIKNVSSASSATKTIASTVNADTIAVPSSS
jgi:hypothetical protein